jgi:hypothetical protein
VVIAAILGQALLAVSIGTARPVVSAVPASPTARPAVVEIIGDAAPQESELPAVSRGGAHSGAAIRLPRSADACAGTESIQPGGGPTTIATKGFAPWPCGRHAAPSPHRGPPSFT